MNLELLIMYSICLIKVYFCLVTRPKQNKPEETHNYSYKESDSDEDLEPFFVIKYNIKNNEQKYLH